MGSAGGLRLKMVAPAVVLRLVLHEMGRSEGRRPPNTEALNLPSGGFRRGELRTYVKEGSECDVGEEQTEEVTRRCRG